MESILLQAKEKFEQIAHSKNILDKDVSVIVKMLSPEEAIGNPERRDFPIVVGKERVIEAVFEGVNAHSFTDTPKEFTGKLKEVLNLPLVSNGERAILIAVMNAVLKYLNIIRTTLHCRDNEPEQCAKEIAAHIKQKYERVKRVGLIGLNPAILESLSGSFGQENINLTDLNRDNIGRVKYGVEAWDGNVMTEKLAEVTDLVLLTGTTFVNDTFDRIWNAIQKYKKEYIIYGVTSAGVCELMNLNRLCPYGRV